MPYAIDIDEFGGSDGIRDLGALEAAVFCPQTGYYEDTIVEAAAPFENGVQNHPFLDGNERSALAAADVHLRMKALNSRGIQWIITRSSSVSWRTAISTGEPSIRGYAGTRFRRRSPA